MAISGDGGVSIASEFGLAQAGYRGVIAILFSDRLGNRRFRHASVGRDGIEANVLYELDGEGEFAKSSRREHVTPFGGIGKVMEAK